MKRFGILVFAIAGMVSLILAGCKPPTSGGGGSKVATPEITPAGSTIEQDTALITITCTTTGAAIHYTTDGTAPSAASPLYTGPLPASGFAEGALIMKAIGTKSGSTTSDVAQEDFLVQDALGPVPVITSIYSGVARGDFDITVTFNETVAGFDQSDLSFDNLNASVAGFVDTNPVFTVTIHPTVDPSTVLIDIDAGVCTDTASALNSNTAADQFSIDYDSNVAQGVITSGGLESPPPTKTSPIPISIDFGKDVQDFIAGDITVGNGSITGFAGGPQVYTADVTPAAEGTVTVDIAAGVCTSVVGGNPNVASPQLSIIYDVTGPSVTINQAAGQNDPTNGTPVNFTAVFSEPVTGFSDGEVVLSGTAGATTSVVTEIAPNDGTTYTVAVSGMSGSGTVVAEILAAGVAQDAAGNGSTPSTSSDKTVTYDITAPTVTINQAAGQNDPTNGGPITFTAVFSEPVTGFGDGDAALSGTAGATTSVVTEIAPNDGTTYTVAVSGMSGSGTVVADLAAGAAQDAAGNGNTPSTSSDKTVTYDITAPTVTIEQGATQSDPTGTSPIIFDVAFSENVYTFATGDVTITGTAGGPKTAVVSGGPQNYTVTVTGMTTGGTVIASIAAGRCYDLAGNNNDASSSTDNVVTWDTTDPTVTINQGGSQPDPTGTSPIVFDVVFSENVTGFETGDVTLAGTAGATTATVSGGPKNYTVSVTGMSVSGGTVIATIGDSVCADMALNFNSASTSTDNTVTWDTTAPTVTINQGGSQSDPTGSSSIVFDVVFSENVNGFATGDVTLSGTAGATTATVSGGPKNYTVTVTGMSTDGTVIADIGSSVCTDIAGNPNDASTSTDNTVSWISTVLIDTSAVSARFTTTPATLNLTVGTNSDRVLVVYVSYYRTAGVTSVSSVTWNSGVSQPLNLAATSKGQSGGAVKYQSEIWYLSGPNTGAGTITANFALAPDGGAKICAISLYNASMAPTPADGFAQGNSTLPSVPITTAANNSMVICGLSGQTANPTITWGTGQTALATWGFLTDLPWTAGSYKNVAAAGATTMTATLAAVQRWHGSAIEVQKAP